MEEFERIDAGRQEMCRQMLRGIQMLEAQQQMRVMEAQAAEAEKLGMDNAASSGREKPPPSPRGMGGGNNPNPNGPSVRGNKGTGTT
jgi:hypothetical protein